MEREPLNKLVNICLEKHLNFVVFSYPNSNQFEIIIEHHLLCNHTQSHFVFHPFQVSLKHPEIKISADYRISEGLIDADFITEIAGLKSNTDSIDLDHLITISKGDYIAELTNGIDHLKTENLDKFIYSRIKTITKSKDLDLTNYLFRLNKKHQSAFVYLLNHQNSGTWMGATPETLLNWTGDQISTMSLAGTLPNNGTDPVWSKKEKEEQAYVTNYISETFSKSDISCEIGETKTVEAGPVFHLKTKLKSTHSISFTDALNFAKNLHPTPAICGVPLEAAKAMIRDIENHDRAYYTGYLGFVNPEKELKLFVNLRCLQVLPNQLALYLGGGITAKSKAEKEWDETNFKAETLLSELE